MHQVVAEGADILDVGGVPAKPGEEVTAAEEIRRVVPFIEAVRAAYPDLVISADTWRHEVGRAACEAGADLLNDTWGGWDPELPRWPRSSAPGWCARTRAACRRGPGRSACRTPTSWRTCSTACWGLRTGRVRAGVDPAGIIIDPAHDFGKNSWHSLEITRRLGELTATGWPVLMSASRKDFVGEALGAGVDDRLSGTLAVTAVGAWLGARIFRAHDVAPDPAGARHGGGGPRRPAPGPHGAGAGVSGVVPA